jgi:hypothetical protein
VASLKRKQETIRRLRYNAALNYANAAHMVLWGAEEEYVQPLRDQAVQWEAEADRLEQFKRKKGIGSQTENDTRSDARDIPAPI